MGGRLRAQAARDGAVVTLRLEAHASNAVCQAEIPMQYRALVWLSTGSEPPAAVGIRHAVPRGIAYAPDTTITVMRP